MQATNLINHFKICFYSTSSVTRYVGRVTWNTHFVQQIRSNVSKSDRVLFGIPAFIRNKKQMVHSRCSFTNHLQYMELTEKEDKKTFLLGACWDFGKSVESTLVYYLRKVNSLLAALLKNRSLGLLKLQHKLCVSCLFTFWPLMLTILRALLLFLPVLLVFGSETGTLQFSVT